MSPLQCYNNIGFGFGLLNTNNATKIQMHHKNEIFFFQKYFGLSVNSNLYPIDP